MKTAILLIGVLIALTSLSGCEQQYRYFCHNPDNWDDAKCKPPVCEVNKDCPRHVLKNSQIDFTKPQENKK
jgi:hypothetical protein